MYRNVSSCVRTADGYSDYFKCPIGLKQGCNLSPQLFLYVANEITKEILKCGKHGVQLLPNTPELFLLLFADDIVLMSDTVLGLQNQLCVLKSAANGFGMAINMQKSKIIVFRLGGHLARNEKWFLGGNV